MQISYSCLGKNWPSLSKKIAVVVGLIALPVTAKLERIVAIKPIHSGEQRPVITSSVPVSDPRTDRLQRFLSSLRCPVSYLAEDFVHAADDNHLDWRLLPSISVIESGGGKAYRNNNIFGWANGNHLFPTLRSAINEVAFKLGKSALYRNCDLETKLHIYNPEKEDYADDVVSVMKQISPVVNLRPARRVRVRAHQYTYATD